MSTNICTHQGLEYPNNKIPQASSHFLYLEIYIDCIVDPGQDSNCCDLLHLLITVPATCFYAIYFHPIAG